MVNGGVLNKIMVVLLGLIGLYVGIAALLYVFQSHFVYFPLREIHSTPRDIGLSYEAVDFESEDGVMLSGWLVPAKKPRAVLLFCHGNGGNISDRLPFIEIFHGLDLSVFIFDYRGYGQSRGKPSEMGTYLDAEAAWDYLTIQRSIPGSHILVLGKSLGGAIAARLAMDHGLAGLILQSAFTSVPDMASNLYPVFPTRLLARYGYTTGDYVRRVNCPVLVVHSREDEIVPYSHGRRLYEMAGDPKEFLEIRGDHNGGAIMSSGIYRAAVGRFVSRIMEGKAVLR